MSLSALEEGGNNSEMQQKGEVAPSTRNSNCISIFDFRDLQKRHSCCKILLPEGKTTSSVDSAVADPPSPVEPLMSVPSIVKLSTGSFDASRDTGEKFLPANYVMVKTLV